MMRAVWQRVTLAGLALLVAAWLVVALRDARQQDEGREIVRDAVRQAAASSGRSAASDSELERAGRLFERAELLNPDRSLLHDDANRLYLQRRTRMAVERLRELVRAEPENVQAWSTLAIVAREVDADLAARALERRGELDPRRATRRR